jgi:hypothetical protein
LFICAVEKVNERSIFVALSRRYFKVKRESVSITGEVDFRGKTPAGSPKSVILGFFRVTFFPPPAAHRASPFVLVMHDWCKLDFKRHLSKSDPLQVTHENDIGYDLTASLAVEADHGVPLAPVAMHLRTSKKLHSTCAAAPKKFDHHLNQLAPTMDEIETLETLRAKSVDMFEKELITSMVAYNLVVQYRRETRLIGPHASRWSEAALKEHGIQGMQIVQGLLSLTRSCECSAIEEACEIAWRSSSLRSRYLTRLLRIRQASQKTTGFTDEHPLIRPIGEVRLKEQRIGRPAETSEAAQSPKTPITSTGLVERSRFNQ